jgi:transcriptional regulator with XRE-family HTH domain
MPTLDRTIAAIMRRLAAIPDGDVSDVARRAGMSPRQLRRLRAGGLKHAQLVTLVHLAEALGITPAELVGGAHPRGRRGTTLSSGRGRGRPRNIRRQPAAGEDPRRDEDEIDSFEDA